MSFIDGILQYKTCFCVMFANDSIKACEVHLGFNIRYLLHPYIRINNNDTHFVVFDFLVIKCIRHRRELNTFMAVKLPDKNYEIYFNSFFLIRGLNKNLYNGL